MANLNAIRRFTLEEYIEQMLQPVAGKMKFPEVHIHGTWKPTIADFRKRGGQYLVEAMKRVHMSAPRKWSDIAQHATIDPDGYIWEGRSLFKAPASATGHNDGDDDNEHPFMFEMIGNFDNGCEKLEGPQLQTAAALTRAVIDLFGAAPKLHREMTNQKTCPGSGITKEWFMSHVEAAKVIKVDPPLLVMDKGEAMAVIQSLQTLWQLVGDKKQREEIHRQANVLRKAAGMPPQ